jgi:hypothetical protein
MAALPTELRCQHCRGGASGCGGENGPVGDAESEGGEVAKGGVAGGVVKLMKLVRVVKV